MTLEPRPAAADDISELLRLRALMFAEFDELSDEEWRAPSERFLRDGLASGDVAAYVVDDPERRGRLVACGVVLVVRRLGAPFNPSGAYAHVQSMVTDPSYRRRGLARAILHALMSWCTARGITSVVLHASTMGEPLYRSVGFHERDNPELRWDAHARVAN